MDNSKFVEHLKNENIDPILILKNLYEQCSSINIIIIQYLNEIIKSINSNNINNINNEISIIFERFKVDVVSKLPELEENFIINESHSYLSTVINEDNDSSNIWRYLKLKNLLKTMEDIFYINNLRNKNKSIALFHYLKDREPSFINNDYMKKHSLQTSYVGKTLDLFSFKLSKLCDNIDTVVNEYNDLVKDRVLLKIKKDKDGEINEDNTDSFNNYKKYEEFVNLNNHIVITEDLTTLIRLLNEYEYAIKLLLIPINDKTGKFNSFNSSLIM